MLDVHGHVLVAIGMLDRGRATSREIFELSGGLSKEMFWGLRRYRLDAVRADAETKILGGRVSPGGNHGNQGRKPANLGLETKNGLKPRFAWWD